jgi:lysine-N-methylase
LLLADDTWAFVAQPRKPDAEALYARAVLHGHQLAGEWPVSIALRDRAVRLLVARALDRLLEQTPSEPHDSATLHPLALVEAMLRGHGLDAYVYDI